MSPYTTDLYISWEELHRDTRKLAVCLLDAGKAHGIVKGKGWAGIIAVSRGGLIPAAIVARELDIRMVDTICVISYAGAEAQEQEPEGAIVILEPDIEDGGAGATAKRLSGTA